MRMRALTTFLVILLAPLAALAYPQFQLSTGNVRCNQCHFAPAGGGLLNSYGRSESADTISNGGNGGFLHGAVNLPSWLALGGDFRVAGLLSNEGASAGTDREFFPMQADLYARVAVGGFSFNG